MKVKTAVLFTVALLIVLLCASIYAEVSTSDIPQLDSLYPAQEVRLKLLSNEEKRIEGYYGPGSKFCSAEYYKPFKQVKVTAYLNEGGWVLVHLKYKTARERYLYFADNAFESLGQVRPVTEMRYYTGSTTCNTQARLGPSTDFFFASGLKNIPSGTELKAFFQKDGFVYAEFVIDKKPARLWIPLSDIKITSSGSYIPAQREKVPSRPGSESESHIITEFDYYREEPCANCGGAVKVSVCQYYKPKNAQYHFVTPYTTSTCDSCGHYSGESCGDTWEEEHSYDRGACKKCGFFVDSGTACSCGDMMIPLTFYIDEPYDKQYHSTLEYMYYYCSNCGVTSSDFIISSELNKHSFNEDGECYYCHYIDLGD